MDRATIGFAAHTAIEPGRRSIDIRPLWEVAEAWDRVTSTVSGANLFHRQRWTRLLMEVYRLELMLAALPGDDGLAAGCLLARTRNPFSPRMVALPFSDVCPPLAMDAAALTNLLEQLVMRFAYGLELRGVAAPPPWQVVDCFLHWTLDLERPRSVLERSSDRNFRRNLRRAIEAGVQVSAGSSENELARFYTLQVATRRRLGMLSQPWRFFAAARRIFAPGNDFQVWMARHGGRDLAGVVLLRDGDRLHIKWAARAQNAPVGANHLLFWSVVESAHGKLAQIDLGRSDRRNEGLNRFKRELGARAEGLPYAFFPAAHDHVSAEAVDGAWKLASQLLRRLPLPLNRALGAALYGFFA